MRAGFETYRAFRQDTKDLQAALKERGKLNIPVLLLAGEASTFIPVSLCEQFGLEPRSPAVRGRHDQGVCQQRRIRDNPSQLSLVRRRESSWGSQGGPSLHGEVACFVQVKVWRITDASG